MRSATSLTVRFLLSLGPVLASCFFACGGDDSAAGTTDVRDDGGSSGPSVDGASPSAGDASEPPPPCGNGAWTTYGHDGRHTFASDACITGPLSVAWQYNPTAPSGRSFEASYRAVAQSDGVFLGWMATAPPYTGTTAADRIDASGHRVWTFDTGTDTNLGNWPSIWNDKLVLNEDGLYFLNAVDGTRLHDNGVDWWGQTVPDPARLYLVNQMQADGPGLFVGAVDGDAKVLWQANKHEMCGKGWGDVMGGMAVDGDVVYYAPKYQTGSSTPLTFSSGVFAFAGADGTPKWNKDTTPASALSVGDGKLFLVEEPSTLVARATSDGSVVWSKPLASDGQPLTVGAQAPVLANGLVIVATSAGLVAVRATTGEEAWTSPVIAVSRAYTTFISNGCGGNIAVGGATETRIAAALASSTLVVTAQDGLHVLSLTTGAETFKLELDAGFQGLRDPVLVGKRVYVIGNGGVIALDAP